ncbi:DUF378 domain-containing protein [Defluviimonas aestuarii]|uniref:DUF378 domain-containing protein n=1 Tax=Albidovulum aestuarii TaxID=1130726 RepID=UPI00249B6E53|nr:DUF378 domain-containing protein [Defluviimonas aestuarii]MDI3336253.1 DUF378 domain-containing protein [Defluviimonas aestuarii]
MQMLNTVTLVLVIVGTPNWGLVGLVNVDLVAAIFADGTILAWPIYVLVALSGLYQARNLTSARALAH